MHAERQSHQLARENEGMRVRQMAEQKSLTFFFLSSPSAVPMPRKFWSWLLSFLLQLPLGLGFVQCKGHWYLALIKTFYGSILMVPEDTEC